MPDIEINVQDYQNVFSASVGSSPLIQVSIDHSFNTVSVDVVTQNPTVNVDIIGTGPVGPKGDTGDTGATGADGADGVSPEVTIAPITGGHSVTITDADHPGGQTFNVMDGADGQNGADGAAAGFGTPTASVDSNVGTPAVTVTASGPDTAKVFDFAFSNLKGDKGDTGSTGSTGPAGPGVPSGGTTGQVLQKKSGTDYDTEWSDLDASDVGALPDDTKFAASPSVGGPATVANGIHYAQVDNTSTATAFTATISGITSYYDGLTILLKNGVITSAAGFTININNLGAKQAYNNMAAATAETTLFNVNYTMLFVYDSTRVAGGGWILYRGYNSNDNTIGYQLRTNSYSLPMTSIVYRYRLLFQSADNAHWVPANNSTSTNATASRTVCQDKINPFGSIVYYGTTTSVAAGSRPSAAYLWEQYTISLGYSFNRTGAALTLTSWKPVYVKAAPQSDGSAIIDSTTPYVQDLPSTEDGKIYIYLGVAYSATNIELACYHPVYCYKGGHVQLWTNSVPTPAEIGAIALPAAPSVGDFLVYTNNGWDADAVPMLPTVSSVDNGKVLRVDNGAWAAVLLPSANGNNF